ncbi:hypothetical protein A1O3_01452 [Capronia epimyces CBS 606.96]|uniref:Uncharacterized protein n=1 Tax=Capronia epimyces CBS 606.96 TaxID=1182542 RepID=W9YK39_9EURO|nr:uncharacterized protein A1O3_01452 [Capronia epimyces CBS 606.96]EXJ92898.1 hypothetical protein A1O3_01452 [Capronia epimyces CBS 606.96]
MAHVKLVIDVLLTHHGLDFEPTTVPMPWKQVPPREGKLCFGLIITDGCVDPQPPIARSS